MHQKPQVATNKSTQIPYLPSTVLTKRLLSAAPPITKWPLVYAHENEEDKTCDPPTRE
jgi:hypothetical protein